jgi:glycosyltransferase involved in cell wall biosynthesis
LFPYNLLERHFGRDELRKPAGKGSAILYVASHCQPYHPNGYAFRTQEILQASLDRGVAIHALTRPGYPWDRKDHATDPSGDVTLVDGVRYDHLPSLGRRWPLWIYAAIAAKKIAKFARARNVRAIHAASNHVNALPALLAAKQLGVPFHYEIRGFWEFSKAAADPQFEHSRRFGRGLALEQLVARGADRVFAISEQVSLYVRKHFGVHPERVSLLPNCVAAELMDRAPAATSEPGTIVYAGSLNDYEGLDLLLFALARLRSRGARWLLKIAGDGPARSALEALAADLQLSDSVKFFGRIPRDKARELMDRGSVVCLPRKPCRVCELVPPLKLVEAMAMGKPIIVPDSPVFQDELGNGVTGLFFRAGSSDSLAEVLDLALSQPEKLGKIGRAARDYIAGNRIWNHHLPGIWRTPADSATSPAHA